MSGGGRFRIQKTYIGRQDDGGWREVQFRHIEWLVEEISRVKLIQRTSSRLRGELLRLLLWNTAGSTSTQVHALETGSQTGNAARSRDSSGRGIVRIRSLVTADSSGLAVWLGRLSAIGGWLDLWLRGITSISWNSSWSSIWSCPWDGLPSRYNITPHADVESAGGILSLLFSAVIGGMTWGDGGSVIVGLVGIWRLLLVVAGQLGRVLAVAVVGSTRHAVLDRCRLKKARCRDDQGASSACSLSTVITGRPTLSKVW